MKIDHTTLTDLEVLRSPDGTEGLFGLIDRTATGLGRKALRARLENPMSDKDQILRTQEAVEFFMQRPSLLRLDPQSCEAVERYLRSNVVLNSGTSISGEVEHLWTTVRYPDVVREVREGVLETRRFLGHLQRLMVSMDANAPPALVSEILSPLRGALDAVRQEGLYSARQHTADFGFRAVYRAQIEQVLASIGELDALNAMALATLALDWTMPDLIESDAFVLEADGVFHPFVDAPVRNPAKLSGGEPVVFLTGPNMAGKTTYLRSVALVVYLAQVGMGVPASTVRLTPVEALLTSLNPSDNLKAGLSYFLAEVMRVKEAASLLADGRRALVMFDEVFKGTNVRDALEASAEVILGFARAPRSGFVFSSHLAELVEALEHNSNVRFQYFDGEIVEGTPRYSYELKDGVSDKRFGFLLLEQAGIPELMAQIGAQA